MTKNYSAHIFCICALFVLGNAIIMLPFYNSGIISLCICAVFSFSLLFLSFWLINLSKKNKIIFYIYNFFVCIAAIYAIITAFLDYLLFLNRVQMTRANIYLLAIVLLGFILFFALNSISAIYKYSLFTAIICILIIIICFFGGIKNFDFSAFKTINTPTQFEIKHFLPIVVLPAFLRPKKRNIKYASLGVLTAYFVLMICFFQTIFTLGIDTATIYPYLKSVSVISSGSLFTRLDALIYFLFFICAVIKICVCIKSIFLIYKTKPRF